MKKQKTNKNPVYICICQRKDAGFVKMKFLMLIVCCSIVKKKYLPLS